ncbi:MAG: FtsW/RodA/SpoVE family cell cycle protein [Oscillibacter sp.]|jgi:rod shape determining protein RodA|nr:FtsW/RodA/SpoVE family cell cycle protein [Oscillibacter sp.]
MFNRLKNVLIDFIQQADLLLLALCVGSTLFGMVLIASATHYMGTTKYVVVQGAALLIGVVAYILLSVIDVEVVARKWKWLLLFNIGFICMLVPFGVSRNGNRAWIQFPWMPTAIQPSEIVKITFIILLAYQLEWIWQEKRELKSFHSVFPPAFHLLFMVGLIYVVSGDMGSALVYVFIFLCMAVAAGMAWRWFLVGFAGGAAGIFGIYKIGKMPSYMMDRFHAIFDHTYQPLGAGWQQTRSLLAIGSGRWFGQGLFHGTQTQSATASSLPYRHTDFIFAVAGEEIGFVGCIVIIVLLIAIIFRCLQVARRARSPFSSYVCVGMAGMLIFQTIENIGMCLFVMPVIGLTLPFFSYGGSSIVTLYAAMGIVSGIKKRAIPDRLKVLR